MLFRSAGRVPPDLSVRIPTLEDALLGLLDGAASVSAMNSDLPHAGALL